MVQCFAPEYNHQSESHTCRFFGFPSKQRKLDEYRRWICLLRRKDRQPGQQTRVCSCGSCHFRDGNKSNGPEIFNRNQNKIFSAEEAKPKKKKKIEPAKKQTLQEMIEAARKREESQQDTGGNLKRPESTTKEIILEAELQQAKSEIIDLNEKKRLLTKTLHSVNLK
ncbi:uncharacterized protein LOC114949838 [Acropora millepora]|uniref:uncharacterized protein LOC114949838 n=1 Tax=Acropora millepora TaxID=45264 RepID=UPI001CF16E71|nr:uncharacterized protein LOC114949838 [Acropora millepora]